ncbi:carbohydrate ABC transporter permease [uncultured Sphaerochaeta sp.]|uniref:carbohydrate ABC transporter permease n=1 Tax=uncultured Sphaerochaeta sp. TaxID=886478 RepID=UPI0029CA6BC9|nr:carbohydrate ABC transporter permease [uncultured Sphaerochaeta sp.]
MKTTTSTLQIKPDHGTRTFTIIGYSLISIITILCFIPFWLIIVASISDEQTVLREGFKLWPTVVSFDAYRSIFQGFKSLIQSYLVTIFITVFGTVSSLLLTSMTGYVLIRQDFTERNKVSFFIYFTTLFSGGVIPSYILFVKYLQIKNSLWALVLPCLLSPWNIFLMRNFMKSIPYSLVEASKIDGANDWQIYEKVMLPLSKAGLATVGLFIALNYWNDWYHASLYITKENLYPLQYLLYRMLSNAEYMKQAAAAGVLLDSEVLPSETLKMATALVVTGPILMLYPFVQKYFVKGIMIGSVKG